MDFSSFRFIPLSESLPLLPFECRDDDLNHFLWDDAKPYLKELMAVTYLLVDTEARQTVAYFSLLNDKVVYDVDNRKVWNKLTKGIAFKKRRKSYPSVKIGRFAVSKHYERNNIGSKMLSFIKLFFTKSNKTGCRFITLDAYADSVDFYKKNGFKFFTEKDKDDETRLMVFDLKPFKDALIEQQHKE